MLVSPLSLPWRAAIGLGLAAVMGALATSHAPAGTAAQISVAPSPVQVATISERTVAPDDAPPAPRLPDLAFAFQVAGTTYVQITNFGERMPLPKHGKARLVHDNGVEAVIAPLRAEDLVASHRAWLARTLDVEGCTAHVTGFALVARVTGEPSYAADVAGDAAWTTRSVLTHGSRVLAAELDRPCKGLYARDAAAPAADLPDELTDSDLARRARRAVFASAAAGETQKEWNEFPDAKHWVDHATVDTRVLRHPRTHETFVLVHAHNEHGCGDPAVNIIGMFRVLPDRTLAPIAIHRADMESIDRVIDVDNDGTFELVGRPWLGLDELLTTPGGELVDSLELPFFGCPC